MFAGESRPEPDSNTLHGSGRRGLNFDVCCAFPIAAASYRVRPVCSPSSLCKVQCCCRPDIALPGDGMAVCLRFYSARWHLRFAPKLAFQAEARRLVGGDGIEPPTLSV